MTNIVQCWPTAAQRTLGSCKPSVNPHATELENEKDRSRGDIMDARPNVRHPSVVVSTTWNPNVCKMMGLLGCVWWLWAVVLHTFGVQVFVSRNGPMFLGRLVLRQPCSLTKPMVIPDSTQVVDM